MGKPSLRRLVEPQAREAHVPFNDFHFFPQKRAELPAMALMERIERGRILDNLFEAAQSRRCAVAANQQKDLPDVGNICEQISNPDLADESRYTEANQRPIGQVLTNRQTLDSRTM